MADSAVNYTEDMVATMTEQYEAEPTMATVEALASQFSKPKRSIISKLSSLGVYKAQPRNTTKRGEPVVRKADIADSIQGALGEQLPTLVKMSKADLVALATLIQGADYHG